MTLFCLGISLTCDAEFSTAQRNYRKKASGAALVSWQSDRKSELADRKNIPVSRQKPSTKTTRNAPDPRSQTLAEALSTFYTRFSPWSQPKEWLQRNATHIQNALRTGDHRVSLPSASLIAYDSLSQSLADDVTFVGCPNQYLVSCSSHANIYI